MASFAVETKSYTGQWKAFPATRPLTFAEAKDEVRFARAMGITGPLRIVEKA
jgi:hypothetical protein